MTRHMADVPMIAQCVGFRLKCIAEDADKIRNMLSLMDEGNVVGRHRSLVETVAAQLRIMADELEGLAGKVKLMEAAE